MHTPVLRCPGDEEGPAEKTEVWLLTSVISNFADMWSNKKAEHWLLNPTACVFGDIVQSAVGRVVRWKLGWGKFKRELKKAAKMVKYFKKFYCNSAQR